MSLFMDWELFCLTKELPIAFASRSMAPAEKHYSQIDKEALAIVFWC